MTDTAVPEPFDFAPWVSAHAAELEAGRSLRLFGEDHPDKEFDVRVIGGPSKQQVSRRTVPLGSPLSAKDAFGCVNLCGDLSSDPGGCLVVARQVFRNACPETWLYQYKGSAVVRTGGTAITLEEGCCCTVASGALAPHAAGASGTGASARAGAKAEAGPEPEPEAPALELWL